MTIYLIFIVLIFILFISRKINKTIDEEQIEFRNGFIYRKHSKKNFTGEVISKYYDEEFKRKKVYKNGKLQHEGIYKKGEANGYSKGYYGNRKIVYEGFFKSWKIKWIL